MKKQITYWSPGFFFCEKREVIVDKLDLQEIKQNAETNEFMFEVHLIPKDKNRDKRSKGRYYIDGTVMELDTIRSLNTDGRYDVMIGNLERENAKAVLTRIKNYFQPLKKGDKLI